jgi:hypothetical protein
MLGGQSMSVPGTMFVDLTYCAGALALTGDSRTASEVLGAPVTDLSRLHQGLRITYLREPPPDARGTTRRIGTSSELTSMIRRWAPVMNAPIVVAAARRQITDIIAVPASLPQRESAEIARLRSGLASTWTAIIAQDVPGAHWRWDARKDGTPSLFHPVAAS